MTLDSAVNLVGNSVKKMDFKELIDWLTRYACRRLNSMQMRERRTIPPNVVLDFARVGLMGLTVPLNGGGLGLKMSQAMDVIAHIAAIDPTLAVFVGIQNTLVLNPIKHYANNSHELTIKLRELASGTAIGAFAVSENSSGSNPMDLSAIAKKVDGGFVLCGRKRWIGNAAWSTIIIVLAKVQPLGETRGGVTAFLVQTDSPGVKIGSEALTLGVNATAQSDVILDDVFVPDSLVLGVVGSGFKVASDAMMEARLGTLACCLGALRRGLQLCHKFTESRVIGNKTLGQFESILYKKNNIAADILILQTVLSVVTKKLDKSELVPVEIYAALKYVGPLLSWVGVDDVMQMFGARGYLESTPIAQIFVDIRLLRIFEGTSETMADFLGRRAIFSTLTPNLLTPEFESDSLRVEFGKILAAIKSKIDSNFVEMGSIDGQLVGRLLSFVLVEQLVLEGAKQNVIESEALNPVLKRLAYYFHADKRLWQSDKSTSSFDVTKDLIASVLTGFPDLSQSSAHPERNETI